ncbi:hypothetical protein FBUS_02185 [Fasciolopsis buskii]|uniref:Uncharacterized protein n=1 Tax=Fasciolopsis buskii TaxID=27845 RepID=A0A8E0S2T7_9TREM|nr:hypothetical protein FBUS_02185 [Fasciolopsis buski]
MGVSPNTVTTSILAAQQQKLLAQLQRQVLGNATVDSLSRSSVEELIPAIGSLPPDTDPNSILVADRVNSASALTAALLRARATNTSVPGLPVTGMSINPTQSNANQLVALLTAAQQNQQQQQEQAKNNNNNNNNNNRTYHLTNNFGMLQRTTRDMTR